MTINLSDILKSASFSLEVVQLGDHCVGWVRDNGADDSSEVTRGKGDRKLSGLVVLGLGFRGENFGVKHFDNFLKEDKLGNSVRNLSSPKRSQSFVKSSGSFFRDDFVHSRNQSIWEGSWLRGLHSDFDCFEGT